MAISLTLYQPYTPRYFQRGFLVYDPRGNSFPYLYSFSFTTFPFTQTNMWRLNRATGQIDTIFGDFNEWSTYGAPDMDETGKLWWAGVEPANLTYTRQAQTEFTADTFVKIGSVVDGAAAIVYPVSGGQRVDRRSGNNLVAHVELSDLFNSRVQAWDGVTRVLIYDLAATNWVYPFVDFDFDANGNLWVLSGDDTHTLLTMVDPSGAVSPGVDLSGTVVDPFALKYLAADDTLTIANSNLLVKWDITGTTVVSTLVTDDIDTGLGQKQSFHHTLDSVTDLYFFTRGVSGPPFLLHQVDLVALTLGTVTDFTAEVEAAGPIWDGFGQGYFAPSRLFVPGVCLYDPVGDAVWVEDGGNGCIGKFAFGGAVAPAIRTTQILAELVLRPHPETGPVLPPPPLVFTQKNLFALIGPAQPMEVCSGYIGRPAIHSQLSQVEAHYNKDLAPLSSKLHAFHTEQIGEADVQSRPGVIWKEDPWFNVRQTNRYHRVCLFCEGDTEVTALTWMLREAGIR